VYADEESYNSGHGHAYEAYGVDPQRGALVVVRPDHCKSFLSPDDADVRLILVQMWRRLLPSMRLTQYVSSLTSFWFQIRRDVVVVVVVDDRLLLSNKVKSSPQLEVVERQCGYVLPLRHIAATDLSRLATNMKFDQTLLISGKV
jgi:hypothetical protein